ncbi:peptidoglycan-binding protein [Amycolatopsis cihanbeyliensis]|uniref:Peptidoglycan hydrolase-like protein with peptidoglycan-binding domain n=1 Tax=Amycolatopsis cihanbeyliensis TaxID=1128664 RepID=A0A542DMI8_AMYCI|nr:peptidoglycan-binding protein [Amycolatopsis cihanbeyliensis]TQJ04299.1 peptidoglycan hydrolase-like protein with peptidoglycan-binding domain [Amycolatopsis cihanbeyliensis]
MRKILASLATGVLVAGAAAVATVPAASAADPPSGSELSAVVQQCDQQVSNGRYAERSGQSRTVPVCATGNAVHWRSGMTIDCDGQRTAKCNSSTDPTYWHQTAWQQPDGKYLNAEKLPYVVVPISTSTWDHYDSGITGGTVVAVVYEGRVVYGVVGDRGPRDAIGEASYALADALGINPNPRTGGVSGKVVDYIAFPGVKASPIEDNADAVRKGRQAAADLVAGREGCVGTQLDFTSYPALEAGATGDRVTAAQCLLRAAGYDIGEGDPSGTLDESTMGAVRGFQSAVGLPAEGTVDAHTWTALLSAGSTPLLREGATGEAVYRVQRAVNAATGARLAMDGIFGPNTAAGVRDYQSASGLGVDGIVGPNTWQALQSGT